MRIVIDANVLIAGLLGSRRTIASIVAQNNVFYAPRRIVDEVLKYEQHICEVSRQTAQEFEENFRALFQFVTIVEYEEYKVYMKQAKEAIAKRDLKDADYIACALTVKADYIWTNDKDFKIQSLISTMTTDEFVNENKKF